MANNLTQYMTAMGPTGVGAGGSGGAGATGAGAGFGGALGSLFSNPDFLKFMAETGASLDPQGVAGALGGSTSSWIEREQSSKALTQLIKALGGNTNLTKIKMDKDGNLELGGAAPAEGSKLEDMGGLDDKTDTNYDFNLDFDKMLEGVYSRASNYMAGGE